MVQFGSKGKVVGKYDPVMGRRKEEGAGNKTQTTYNKWDLIPRLSKTADGETVETRLETVPSCSFTLPQLTMQTGRFL